MRDLEEIGSMILGAAINVHSHLGPGLLEPAYQKCLCYELQKQGLKVRCEVPLPIIYQGVSIEVGYRLDMIVEDCVLVENKAVDKVTPVHEAQLLTYLRLNEYQLGYLLNWNVALMKHGIKRMVNRLQT